MAKADDCLRFVGELVSILEIRMALNQGMADNGAYGGACNRAAETLAGLLKSEPEPFVRPTDTFAPMAKSKPKAVKAKAKRR